MDFNVIKNLGLKVLTLEKGLVSGHKEKLLFAYAFLNTSELYKPECNFYNGNVIPKEEVVYGEDIYSASYGGGNSIPDWREFYNENEGKKDVNFVCIAGTDENDTSQVRVTFLTGSTFKKMPKAYHGIIPVSIEGPAKKAEVRQFLDKTIKLYKEYKTTLIAD